MFINARLGWKPPHNHRRGFSGHHELCHHGVSSVPEMEITPATVYGLRRPAAASAPFLADR